MRIDFSWGNLRNREELPVTRVAEIVLGRRVAELSFGPGLPWLDVLFAVPGKGKPRPLKTLRRYPGSFVEHVIVEVRAPDVDSVSLRDAITTLIAVVPGALDRAQPLLDKKLPFDAKGVKARVDACLKALPTERALRDIAANLEPHHAARFAAMERGKEALRRAWPRPLVRPLRWVRVHDVLPAPQAKGMLGHARKLVAEVRRGRSPLADACRAVGALLGSALSDRILTPRYEEIYVNVGPDAQELRWRRTAVEHWHENAYAVVPAAKLEQTEPAKLRRVVFDASRAALLELAEVDHLDRGEIVRCLAPLDPEGLSNVFEYRRVEKGDYVAALTYSLAERRDDGAIVRPIAYLDVAHVSTGRRVRRALGPVDLWETSRVLKKLALTAKEARVDVGEGGKSKTVRVALAQVS